VIKVCLDDQCSEVAHFIERSEKHCRNCGKTMIAINWQTYEKKFADEYFQYDYRTGDFYRPLRAVATQSSLF
jgi:hypothetical protein